VGNGEVLGLVFDLPEAEWMDDVRRIRLAYDNARSSFPIEITVAGSSGLGWLSRGQTLDTIAGHLQAITQTVAPFNYAFSRVEVFPQSHVYYLALANE